MRSCKGISLVIESALAQFVIAFATCLYCQIATSNDSPTYVHSPSSRIQRTCS